MSKKKILLLADDFRLPSGIGTVSKEIIFNTVKKYDWIQLGSALNHPEAGKGLDLSTQVAQETGIEDADVKIIPWNGYGDRNILFSFAPVESVLSTFPTAKGSSLNSVKTSASCLRGKQVT